VTVLIVDDSAAWRLGLAVLLRRAGARTMVAASGTEALTRLALEPADVILSDIAMPGLSGHDFVRAVRRLPAYRTTPAIAITGLNEASQREEAHRAGFQLCLNKPVDAAGLVEAIARLTRRQGGPGAPDAQDRPRRRKP
jgi:two-component system CheB/CheR fusion protein